MWYFKKYYNRKKTNTTVCNIFALQKSITMEHLIKAHRAIAQSIAQARSATTQGERKKHIKKGLEAAYKVGISSGESELRNSPKERK